MKKNMVEITNTRKPAETKRLGFAFSGSGSVRRVVLTLILKPHNLGMIVCFSSA